ncbi:unnamed protein product, partial [Leptidea sinapis]
MKIHPQPAANKNLKRKHRKNWLTEHSKADKVQQKKDEGFLTLLGTSLRHQTGEFFSNSTLHGVRYIAEKERPFCEKYIYVVQFYCHWCRSNVHHYCQFMGEVPDKSDYNRVWDSDPPEKAEEFLRWLSTLSYESIAARGSEFVSDVNLVGSKGALFNPKEAVFSIYIHSTEEMAGLEQTVQHSWDRRVEKVSFSVKHTYTTEDARQLSVRQRRCVFPDEQRLETSTTYTYTACMRQCRMQRSRSYCKCVPHFYPSIMSFGGIAGLFLGFSLLSGVELVYYFTLRAFCAAVRDADLLKQERNERLMKPKPPHNLSLVP